MNMGRTTRKRKLVEWLESCQENQVSVLDEKIPLLSFAVDFEFIIIIDEWDVLIRDESANKKVQDEYIRFLRSMFKGTEPTKYIQLAYLTGILPIKKKEHNRHLIISVNIRC